MIDTHLFKMFLVVIPPGRYRGNGKGKAGTGEGRGGKGRGQKGSRDEEAEMLMRGEQEDPRAFQVLPPMTRKDCGQASQRREELKGN